MVLNYARNLENLAKEGSKGTTQWVAYYFTNIKVIRIPISHRIKQKEIVGRVFLGSQVVSLTAITFFTYSNICQLWRILLHYLFLIFVLTIP